MTAFSAGVSDFAIKYVRSGGADRRSGTCALRWLSFWAKARAMTQMPDHNAQFRRSVQLSGWAIDYAMVRNITFKEDDPKPMIERWFAEMAADLRVHTDQITNATARNNHRYWAGLAAMAVAMNTGDQSLAQWALASARIGLDQVDSVGALPLELRRAAMARHYHLYAAAPLVMTIEIAAANGTDLSSYNDGALHRLVAFAISSISSPSLISSLSGAPQQAFVNSNGRYNTQDVAWFEFYNRRFPDRLPDGAGVLANRPLVNIELGGDLTLLAAKR
ncbi:alginate lyase family protein [Rhizorhabdus argentea]|uniref:alginate lyase family protein n=1 Tax=Rhizorhabdus argentea TaxID=1387174 RepID=UPI0030EEBB7E